MPFFCAFFLFCNSIFASLVFDDCVNALTKQCIVSCEDARIDGLVPLVLRRTYVSGNWSFLPHGQLILKGKKNKRGQLRFYAAQTAEPSGLEVIYKLAPGKVDLFEIDWSSSAGLLAYREHGWSRQRIERTSSSMLTLFAADGTRRLYKWLSAYKETSTYVLTCEELPNGCAIYYAYDDFNRLYGFRTLDATRNQTFASCTFHYPQKPGKGNECRATLSDGRTFVYTFKGKGDLLLDVNGSKHMHYEGSHLKSWSEGKQLGYEGDAVSSSSDSQGNSHQFLYFPERTEIRDPNNKWTIVHMDNKKFPVRVDYCDTNRQIEQSIELAWSSQGELLSRRTLSGSGEELLLEEYILDGAGNLIEERLTGDLRGLKGRETISTLRAYSPDGQLVRQEDPSGLVTEYDYLYKTQLVTASRTLSNEQILKRSFFEYNPANALVKVIEDDGSGHAIDDLTDVFVRKISQFVLTENKEPPPVKPKGPPGSINRYTARGDLAQILYEDGKEDIFRYRLDGKLECTVDAEGLKTTYSYDPLGNVTEIYRFSPEGTLLQQEFFHYKNSLLLSKTDAAGTVTTYTYDAAGRCISEETASEQILYSYDGEGRQNLIQEGEFLQKIEYDARHLPIRRLLESQSGELILSSTYEYDARGQLIKETRGNQIKTIEYDSTGRPIVEIDFNGHRYETKYDLGGHIINIEEFSPEGERLSWHNYAYDALGRCIAEESADISIATTYDLRNRIKSQTIRSADGEETIEFEDNRTIQSKPDGRQIINIRDALGRVIEISSSDNQIHQRMSYNGRGQLVQAVDEIARTSLERTYDAKGRLISETLPTGLKMCFEYDKNGRKKRIVLPDDSCILYRYDSARLKDIERLSPTGSLLYKHALFDYDSAGFPRHQRLIDELGELSYSLDQFGRIDHLSSPFGEFHLGPSTHRVQQKKDQRGMLIHFENTQTKIDWSYDILGRCVMKRELAFISRKWKLKSALFFLYDGEVEIGAIDEKGKLKQLKVCAPIRVNSGDNSVVFELDGRLYVPLFDPAGDVRQLLSLNRRGTIEFYSYDASNTCTVRNEWGDIISPPGVANPWRLHGLRLEN